MLETINLCKAVTQFVQGLWSHFYTYFQQFLTILKKKYLFYSRSLIQALGNKLNDYWNEKMGIVDLQGTPVVKTEEAS